ncbi:MAG: DUF3037 domain-containing protein [Deltaproteobacteria bacterium]|nr:DUF3037 domain-containing protein [Deltaproteobacteria bacterium]MDZ4344602.1 DUF3037 domain-containing protein [Candidatus Binatia bacterium]
MPFGAYSVVRFSNNASDQRVNVGVLVWHPLEGVKYKFSPSLDRIQAVDPRVSISSVKEQLEVIRSELASPVSEEGPVTLNHLSSWFKNGVEVSTPYPARIASADELLDRLYETLVYPVPEIQRASSQRQFERSFEKTLKNVIKDVAPKIKCERLGTRKIGKVLVNVGIRTTGPHHKTLWHPLSLLSKRRPDEQIALSKATAMDINVIRASANGFTNYKHLVTLQTPRVKDAHALKDSVDWLKHEADDVIEVRETQDLGRLIQQAIQVPT